MVLDLNNNYEMNLNNILELTNFLNDALVSLDILLNKCYLKYEGLK
jgi:hypothetical protein